MSWRTVTEDDLLSTLSQAEVDAFRAAEFGGNPVADLIRDEVAFVRGVIRSSSAKTSFSPDELALPASLIRPAMDHLRFSVLTRLDLKVNESRTLAYNKACELFDNVRQAKFVPESYDDGENADNAIAGSPASVDRANPPRMLD